MAEFYASMEYETARLKIEGWCAWQERCRMEVKHKLTSWKLSDQHIATLIVHLESNRFLDEERFAEAYVSGKFRIKHWGRIKIKQHLKLKQVPEQFIRKALAEIDDQQYLDIMDQLIERKKKMLKAGLNAWQLKAKLVQYLQSKGFEYDLILDRLAHADLESAPE